MLFDFIIILCNNMFNIGESMEELDKRLLFIKGLYERSKIGDRFESDLETGVIAKIDIDKHKNFSFSDFAQLATSINIIDKKRYQYFVFKNGYYYKNGKFVEVKNGKKKTLSTAKAELIK